MPPSRSIATSFLFRCDVGRATFTKLADFCRHDANLACHCRGCGRVGVVHRDRFARWCFLHRKPTALEVLPRWLRCSRCGGRPSMISPTPKGPTFPRWGEAEEGWKRLHRKLRG